MTQTFFPFDSGAGAAVAEDQWRKMARLWLPTGVISGESNEGAVTQRAAGANLSVDVATAVAWVRGHYFESDAVENLAINAEVSGNDRIDRVVIRADFVANTIELTVLEGTPSATPQPPALQQDADAWEVSLAQVAVADSATSIVDADITDERALVSTSGSGGGAWVDWAPLRITQDGADSTNIFNLGGALGRYSRVGNIVFVMLTATANGAGVASQSITVQGLPVAPVTNTSLIGVARYSDPDGNQYLLSPVSVAGTSVRFIVSDVPATFLGVNGPTVASGDQLFLNLMYEAAA